MNTNVKKGLQLIACSCWLVPIYLYILIPLLLSKHPIAIDTLLISASLSFILIWVIKWKWYRERNMRKRFLLDFFVMTAGLTVLYCMELGLISIAGNNNTWLYVVLYLTNVPSSLSNKLLLQASRDGCEG